MKRSAQGFKFAQYEMEGVPVRIGLGKRDLANGVGEVARRDLKSKESINLDGIANHVESLLNDIQQNLFETAKAYRADHTTEVSSFDEFKEVLEGKGGFVSAHWDGSSETEQKIKELTKATIRCIPNDAVDEEGKDMLSGKVSTKRVLFAKAY